jgi:hypothetical protein
MQRNVSTGWVHLSGRRVHAPSRLLYLLSHGIGRNNVNDLRRRVHGQNRQRLFLEFGCGGLSISLSRSVGPTFNRSSVGDGRFDF